MNSRPLAILAGAVLLAAVGAVWYMNMQQPEPGSSKVAPVAVSTPSPNAEPGSERPTPIAKVEPATPAPAPAKETPQPKDEPPKPMAEWEQKIDKILTANADETATAQMLINLLPTLPAEGQAEAAQHISNLILDKDYNKVLPLVKNPGLPEEVLDVFVTDLMNREDDVKLPALLEIAKIPNHPHHEEAQTDLQIFLDEDYGQDWTKWQTAMKNYLKKQADENAEAEKEANTPTQLPANVPRAK